jgi:hypothetical protein
MPTTSTADTPTNPAVGPGAAPAPATPKPADPASLGYKKTDAEGERKKALAIAAKLFDKDKKRKEKDKAPEALEEEVKRDDDELDEELADEDDEELDEVTATGDDDEPGDEEADESEKAPSKSKKKKDDDAGDAEAEKSKKGERLEKAKLALLRDKMKPSVLAKLSEEEILELGEARAEQQKRVDGFGNEMKKLKAQLAQGQQPPASAKKDDDKGDDKSKEAQAQQTQTDGDTDYGLDTMLEHAGPEVTNTIKKAFKTLEDSHREELSTATNAARSMLLRGARKDLKEAFPQVDDSKTWDKVVRFATALAQSGDYPDGDEDRLFQDAARAAIPDATETAQRKLLAKQKRAKAGQMDRGGDDRSGGSKKLSAVDQAKLAGQLLKQGKNPGTIRKLLAAKS